MPSSGAAVSYESFQSFGDLLKYLRKRARLTQRELGIAIGYSEAQISRLEKNLRPPDMAALTALFIPALYIEDEPLIVSRLMELAADARGEKLPASGVIAFSQTVQRQEAEKVRTVEAGGKHNLPLQLTSFIGREPQIAEVTGLLGRQAEASEGPRLITLLGSGGCGKTRLALECARRLLGSYSDGVWLVELAPISDPSLVAQAIVAVVGATDARKDAPSTALIESLRSKEMLLLLDNCEQVVSGTARVARDVLSACPGVRILATSREVINVPGEHQVRVPPLALPDKDERDDKNVARSESVQLFVERAQSILPTFRANPDNLHTVAQVCRRLDGIPLAIELAAARMTSFSIQQIAERLEGNFGLLGGGSATLPRHQTLRAAIAWSYDLLAEPERALLDRLSVFSGGWTLAAAETVVGDSAGRSQAEFLDLLSQLVNKSLITVEWGSGTDPRYSMLQTIHEFAREKLIASGELERMRAAHFDYYFRLVQQGESSLFVNAAWIGTLEAEIDNLRAALAWALERDAGDTQTGQRAEAGLELMLHVWPLWLSRGFLSEGNEWMNQFLAAHTTASLARARALLLAGDFARFRGEQARQVALIEESLALARQLNDPKRIAWALMEMGLVEGDLEHYDRAIPLMKEARDMFDHLAETLWVYRTLFLMAEVQMHGGDLAGAKSSWEQGLLLCRQADDRWHIAWGLEGLGNVESMEGRFAQAGEFYSQSLALKASVDDRAGLIYSLMAFAQLAAMQQQFERAAILWGAAERTRRATNVLLLSARTDDYTSLASAARSELSQDAFDAAWNQGYDMTTQQAIDFALTPHKG